MEIDMYAKIQKGKSNSYMLIQVKEQATLNPRINTGNDIWDYMIAQQETSGECGDDEESSKQSGYFLETIGVENGGPFIVLSPAGYTYAYGNPNHELHMMCNVSIAHVNVDGVSYLTDGNVYILNDEGQTIQRI